MRDTDNVLDLASGSGKICYIAAQVVGGLRLPCRSETFLGFAGTGDFMCLGGGTISGFPG